jgi:hypothetical protein
MNNRTSKRENFDCFTFSLEALDNTQFDSIPYQTDQRGKEPTPVSKPGRALSQLRTD